MSEEFEDPLEDPLGLSPKQADLDALEQQLKKSRDVFEMQQPQLRARWQNTLSQWSRSSSISADDTAARTQALTLARQGMPPAVRGSAWFLGLGNALRVTVELYETCASRAEKTSALMGLQTLSPAPVVQGGRGGGGISSSSSSFKAATGTLDFSSSLGIEEEEGIKTNTTENGSSSPSGSLEYADEDAVAPPMLCVRVHSKYLTDGPLPKLATEREIYLGRKVLGALIRNVHRRKKAYVIADSSVASVASALLIQKQANFDPDAPILAPQPLPSSSSSGSGLASGHRRLGGRRRASIEDDIMIRRAEGLGIGEFKDLCGSPSRSGVGEFSNDDEEEEEEDDDDDNNEEEEEEEEEEQEPISSRQKAKNLKHAAVKVVGGTSNSASDIMFGGSHLAKDLSPYSSYVNKTTSNTAQKSNEMVEEGEGEEEEEEEENNQENDEDNEEDNQDDADEEEDDEEEEDEDSRNMHLKDSDEEEDDMARLRKGNASIGLSKAVIKSNSKKSQVSSSNKTVGTTRPTVAISPGPTSPSSSSSSSSLMFASAVTNLMQTSNIGSPSAAASPQALANWRRQQSFRKSLLEKEASSTFISKTANVSQGAGLTFSGFEATISTVANDLSRTFPEYQAFFQPGSFARQQLQRVLSSYAFFRPDHGYVQGMSHLAAVIILTVGSLFPDEKDDKLAKRLFLRKGMTTAEEDAAVAVWRTSAYQQSNNNNKNAISDSSSSTSTSGGGGLGGLLFGGGSATSTNLSTSSTSSSSSSSSSSVAMIIPEDIPSEVLVFQCFANLMARAPLRWIAGKSTSRIDAWYSLYETVLVRCLPRLTFHLRTIGAQPHLYIVSWLLTLFSRALGLEVAARLWDLIIIGGHAEVLRACIGLMKHLEPRLMGRPFERIMRVLTQVPPSMRNPFAITASIESVRFQSSELAKLAALDQL